jgi:hypothetical protein
MDKVRKIGWEKATLFNKNFDKIYDYWKQKAINDYNYHGELKLIKEHNKVLIYIIIPDINQFTERDEWNNKPFDDENYYE